MAYGNTGMGFIVVLVIMLWSGGANAQSDCTSVLISMSPCVNYITGNSSTPSPQCCTQLASVVRSSPQCLCQVLNGGGSSLGINVNETQAKALPGACRVQTPPVSSCNAASPAASPTGSPTNSQTNPSGVGKGSTTVPSTEEGGSTSDGSSVKLSTSLLFFLLLVAYGSIVRTY